MDGHRFDEVARSLTRGTLSRRVLAVALTATMGGVIWDDPAESRKRCKASRSGKRKKCKKRPAGKGCRPAEPSRLAKCDQDTQCCGGLVCEERACKAGCHIGGAFQAPGATNPANRCQLCQPATSTTAWTNNACGDCQLCDPGTGACTVDPTKWFTACGKPGADGYRPGLCYGDTCKSPCGEACADYCYLPSDGDEPDLTRPFCCPPEARGPDGACCWIDGDKGIFVEGECTAPSQVCADGAACPIECCGGSRSGFAGICPSAAQICIDGAIKDANFACTTDQDCVTGGYGDGARCADLDYSGNQNGAAIPVPGTGFCCPVDAVSGLDQDRNGGAVYSCCSPGTLASTRKYTCCSPAIRTCSSECECSFRRISRCC